MKNTKIMCSQCVMDTTDKYIKFDNNGKCDHCVNYETNILPHWHTGMKLVDTN